MFACVIGSLWMAVQMLEIPTVFVIWGDMFLFQLGSINVLQPIWGCGAALSVNIDDVVSNFDE